MGRELVKMERQRNMAVDIEVHQGTIEGIILVNGRPQIERADMPLTFSFDSIEQLERFCKTTKTN